VGRRISEVPIRSRNIGRSILKDVSSVITRGSTFDNAANLPNSFLSRLKEKYEGTRLGRQELFAEVLDDVPGALWTRDMLDDALFRGTLPEMKRVVVAVDPSGTSGDDDTGDSVGIVAVGLGVDGISYVLADRTCKLPPSGWARRAIAAYHEFDADRIVAETNFGGAMVESVLRSVDPRIAYKQVTASRGKVVRAEPIAALYEQSKVKHTAGLSSLEDQMVMMASDGYLGDGSPDRVDALVWAVTDLVLGARARPISSSIHSGPY
jgi:phage terminase large subunit-like protein